MKIDTITIQGMHKIDGCKTYILKDFIYLFGKNGAGKSTVMQAIQLAILGYIPGTDRTKTAIFSHANGNMMEVTATFDNGTGIIRSWEKSGANIKADVQCLGGLDLETLITDVELPIFDFSEFIGLSANKLKDWFVNFFPTNAYSVDWTTELRNAVLSLGISEDKISEVVTHITNEYGTDINAVRKFNEKCKTNISSKKGELARVQSTIQSLIHYDDCDPMLNADTIKADIATAEIVLDGLKAKQTKYEQYEKAKATIDEIKGIIGDYTIATENPEYCKILSDKADIQTKYDNLNTELKQASQSNTKHCTILDQKSAALKDINVCPITKKSCSEISSMQDSIKAEIEAEKVIVAEFADKISSMTTQVNELQTELNRLNTAESVYLGAYQKYQAVAGFYDPTFDSISKESITKEIESKSMELATLRSKLIEVEANARYEALTDKLTAEKVQIELDLEMYKAWEKLTSINGLQTKLMNQPFADFSTKMTKYIQKFYGREDVFAGFCLIEKANSFSFGLNREGKYIPYDLLSSGEKCMYMLSLILTINDESNSDLKLVLVDDLLDHLDAENIYNTFITLYNNTSSQIIIAGVQPYNYENADDIVITIGD